jgi:hypothetical protein
MISSKSIPIIVAALCGLAFQLQASAVHAQSATLLPGASLTPGHALQSGNGHTLSMQQNGNVVLYTSEHVAIWATNTDKKGGERLVMQDDGNLVLYSNSGPIWSSNTMGNTGAFLKVQDDGNLVIYRHGSHTETRNNAVWSSRTYGR